MNPKSLGNTFVVAWIAVAVIYDCWVYFGLRQPPATISDTLRSWVQFSPLVLKTLKRFVTEGVLAQGPSEQSGRAQRALYEVREVKTPKRQGRR